MKNQELAKSFLYAYRIFYSARFIFAYIWNAKYQFMSFINYNTKNKATIFPGIQSAMEHSNQVTFGCVSLEAGVIAPIHSHPHEQITYILEGQLDMTIGEEQCTLTAGMFYVIHSNVLHGAVAVTDCKVIDVFNPVREDYR